MLYLALAVAIVGEAQGAPHPAAPVRQQSSLRVAVLDLAPATPADAAVAALLSGALTEAVAAAAGDATVVSQGELKGMLDAAALQQLLGCDDERCHADLTTTLAVDQLVVGRAGRARDQLFVYLALIDTRHHAVLARTSFASPASAALDAVAHAGARTAKPPTPAAPPLVGAVATAAQQLFLPQAAAGGDRLLVDLRLAVLLDELDEDGHRLRTQPVETCVQNELMHGGAAPVSPAVVAALKGEAKPRDILDGRIPEGLGSDEVDVIFAGVVQYDDKHAEAGAARLGLSSVRAEMGAQLVRIDTGRILASEQPSAVGRGHSAGAARADAATQLCATLRGLLETALRRRVDHGPRVVVELTGAVDVLAAGAFADELEKLRRVGRAKLKKSGGGKAIFEVSLTSGDGVALALDLARAGIAVEAASAGVVKVVKVRARRCRWRRRCRRRRARSR